MELPIYIYAIQHNVTKRIYVGRSNNVSKRYMSHLYQLRKGTHSCEEMQKDYDEYGEDYSCFMIQEVIDDGNNHFAEGRLVLESIFEYKLMEKLKTIDRRYGYNYADFQAIRYIEEKNSNKKNNSRHSKTFVGRGTGEEMSNAEKITYIANHYGFEHQREIAIEQMAELTKTINKLKRAKQTDEIVESYRNLKEEIADVLIMTMQMVEYFDEKSIYKIVDEKLERQMERIANGK